MDAIFFDRPASGKDIVRIGVAVCYDRHAMPPPAEKDENAGELSARAALLFDSGRSSRVVLRSRTGCLAGANLKARQLLDSAAHGSLNQVWDLVAASDVERLLAAARECLRAGSRIGVDGVVFSSAVACREKHELTVVPWPDVDHEDSVLLTFDCHGQEPLPRVESSVFPVGGDATATILHDLRNLLFPVMGHAELAMASIESGSDAFRSLLEVKAACRSCEEVLQRIEEIARPLDSPARPVHPRDVLERLRLLLRYSINRDFAIEIDAPEDLCPIEAAPARFQQFLARAVLSLLQGKRPPRAIRMRASARPELESVLLEIRLRGLDRDADSEPDRVARRLRELDGEVAGSCRRENEDLILEFLMRCFAQPAEIATHADRLGRGESIAVARTGGIRDEILRDFLASQGFAVDMVDSPAGLKSGASGHRAAIVELGIFRRDPEPWRRRAQDLPVIVPGAGAFDEVTSPVRPLLSPYRMDELGRFLRTALDAD